MVSKELENRFLSFGLRTRNFCWKLKQDSVNASYVRQLTRSSSSIGANYIEASDDLGRFDELMKIKISRREAKESFYWLSLIMINSNEELEMERRRLLNESEEIRKSFPRLS
jgi:four helix bundle protein